MKQSVTFSRFCDAFRAAGRQDQFTYNGLVALYKHLEEYEEETGEQMTLDVVELCGLYAEGSFDDIAADYDIEAEDPEDPDSVEEAVTDYLRDNSRIVGTVPGGLVYTQF